MSWTWVSEGDVAWANVHSRSCDEALRDGDLGRSRPHDLGVRVIERAVRDDGHVHGGWI